MSLASRNVRAVRALELGMNWFDNSSGGLDRVYCDTMGMLKDVGIDATGLVIGPDDVGVRTAGLVQSFGRKGAPSYEQLWRARCRIGELVRTGSFDLVSSHFAMFTLPALDQFHALPLVAHFHGPWAGEAKAEGQAGIKVMLKRSAERAVYRQADRVIVRSKAFGVIARDEYRVPEERIRHVPGGVDLARFNLSVARAEACERLGWPRDRRILLSVRRLARRMGLDSLIGAMPAIVKAEPSVLLMIAGRGHLINTLRAQVDELGLANYVQFLGFVPDDHLALAYRAAEINVIPTIALEGFGLTAIEAMASGTPSMVTPVGALPEVARTLSPDLVFRSSESNDIADGLIAALTGAIVLPNEQACACCARAHYSVAAATAAVADIYRELV